MFKSLNVLQALAAWPVHCLSWRRSCDSPTEPLMKRLTLAVVLLLGVSRFAGATPVFAVNPDLTLNDLIVSNGGTFSASATDAPISWTNGLGNFGGESFDATSLITWNGI